MSDPLKYSVGWICASTTELVAACAFLDEEHEQPSTLAEHDRNSYVLGKFGINNVVIASSPSGEYGTASAATVAQDMLCTFPNIRFGLIVGIGSGAPSSKHNIRLGDVVVGCPRKDRGGVFQYDFDRTVKAQSLVWTGFVNQPPKLLREAVDALEAMHAMDGHRFDGDIELALERKPRLRKKYSRPPPSTDILYKSPIFHDSSGMRSENNPTIHYGLIGSSDQLMKDERLRNRLTGEENVLCFDIGANGLVNNFPCLVIRGICDYADSHTTKEWQGYAAMAAAAYATDILRQISPRMTEREIVIQGAPHSREKPPDHFIIERVKRWLSTPEMSTYSKHTRVEQQGGLGTCFLRSTAFNEWKNGIRRHVWLHGISRSDKTMLSTAILDHVSQINDHISLDFSFDFSDPSKQNIDAMYRSLAFQLYQQHKASRKVLDEHFASNDNGRRQAETEKLSECLKTMLQVSGKIYIILDALDECVNTAELLALIKSSVSSPRLHNVQLFATSRSEEYLRRGIRECIGEKNCIQFDKNFLDEDIGAYISSRLEQSQSLKRWYSTPGILDKIRYEVERNADGMFRLAACQLDDLEQSLTFEELILRLDDLPRDLSAMYDRMILSIPPEFKSDALCLLRFLVHAERPVTLAEAVNHISTQAEHGQVDDVQRRLLVDDNISLYCPGLISITEESRDGKITKMIQLAHITVKEYLMCRSEFQVAPNTASVAFAESYGPSSVASQIFSDEAVSTKQSSLEENINAAEDHATRQMAQTFYSHKQIESSCDDINDDIRSLISGPEDIQSQDGSDSPRSEVREAAVNYLADMLTNNIKLGPLYEEAFKGAHVCQGATGEDLQNLDIPVVAAVSIPRFLVQLIQKNEIGADSKHLYAPPVRVPAHDIL
ncbi:Vegetative incompatibility protein HET-E-1 [Colletotrichum siamense]|nr:Vegetative incompatibility protein HET-E-1 [Colletotrichum siamense]